MEISNATLDWTSDDTLNLVAFLNTVTGKRLLPKLVESAPRLLAKGETNEILIRNGMLIGFQAAVQGVLDLTTVEQTKAPAPDYGEYPPLDDDAAWGDTTKK